MEYNLSLAPRKGLLDAYSNNDPNQRWREPYDRHTLALPRRADAAGFRTALYAGPAAFGGSPAEFRE